MISPKCQECRERVLSQSMIFQFLGTFFKVIVGLIAQSQALLADGMHSLLDCFAFTVTYYGSRRDNTKAFLQSIIVGSLMFVCGMWICAYNTSLMIAGTPVRPGIISLVVSLFSIMINYYLLDTTRCVQEHMPEDEGVALCHIQNKTNFFSACAAFFGILLAIVGFPIMDPLLAFVIGGIQLFGAAEIFGTGFGSLKEPLWLTKKRLAALLGVFSLILFSVYTIKTQNILESRKVILIPSAG
ncbi:MAG: cation transporter, partial [Planctomycetes bacterium]|nr:cation transporter [Planctomycetota bacterium]